MCQLANGTSVQNIPNDSVEIVTSKWIEISIYHCNKVKNIETTIDDDTEYPNKLCHEIENHGDSCNNRDNKHKISNPLIKYHY